MKNGGLYLIYSSMFLAFSIWIYDSYLFDTFHGFLMFIMSIVFAFASFVYAFCEREEDENDS
jgi:hypothetical protein